MVSKDIEEFEKRWEKKCKDIEKISLDNNQARGIVEDFFKEWEMFGLALENYKDEEMILMMAETVTDINISLQTAISNYRKENKLSWWKKIIGERPVSIDFNLLKNTNKLV